MFTLMFQLLLLLTTWVHQASAWFVIGNDNEVVLLSTLTLNKVRKNSDVDAYGDPVGAGIWLFKDEAPKWRMYHTNYNQTIKGDQGIDSKQKHENAFVFKRQTAADAADIADDTSEMVMALVPPVG